MLNKFYFGENNKIKIDKIKRRKIDKIKINPKEKFVRECLNRISHNMNQKKKNWEEAERKFTDTEFTNIFFKSWSNFYKTNLHDDSRDYYRQHTFLPRGYNIKTEREYGSILGLQGRVQKSEIKNYWRKELLRWHPDKWINGSDQEQKKAHEKTVLINEAYTFFKRRYAL